MKQEIWSGSHCCLPLFHCCLYWLRSRSLPQHSFKLLIQFIAGHFTWTFFSFHLIWLLSSIDRMADDYVFRIGVSVSEKPFSLSSINLLGIASQVWVALFFQALFKNYTSPPPRVQWWVFSWIQLWAFISSYSVNSLYKLIHTDSFHCYKYLFANPFSIQEVIAIFSWFQIAWFKSSYLGYFFFLLSSISFKIKIKNLI